MARQIYDQSNFLHSIYPSSPLCHLLKTLPCPSFPSTLAKTSITYMHTLKHKTQTTHPHPLSHSKVQSIYIHSSPLSFNFFTSLRRPSPSYKTQSRHPLNWPLPPACPPHCCSRHSTARGRPWWRLASSFSLPGAVFLACQCVRNP